MITLHTFGPMFGLPDPSPFVTKADVLLRMSGLPFQSVIGSLPPSPKGKLPYIEVNGRKLGDSTFLRLYLEREHGIDFDAHLSAADKGVAWSVEKMLEDNLYWAIVHARWVDDRNFDKGPRKFFDGVPAPLRPFVVWMVRREVARNLHGHGMGRHSRDEIVVLGNRAIDALASVLGDKPYLMGAQRCGADATVLAFIAAVLTPFFDTPMRHHAEAHENLVRYRDRLLAEFYPAP